MLISQRYLEMWLRLRRCSIMMREAIRNVTIRYYKLDWNRMHTPSLVKEREHILSQLAVCDCWTLLCWLGIASIHDVHMFFMSVLNVLVRVQSVYFRLFLDCIALDGKCRPCAHTILGQPIHVCTIGRYFCAVEPWDCYKCLFIVKEGRSRPELVL